MTDEQVLVVDVDMANQYLEQGGWRVVSALSNAYVCIAKQTRVQSTGPR